MFAYHPGREGNETVRGEICVKFIAELMATLFFVLGIAALIGSIFSTASSNLLLGSAYIVLGILGFSIFCRLNMYADAERSTDDCTGEFNYAAHSEAKK